jgi:hypothetical protein
LIAVVEDRWPDEIAIAGDHGVSAAMLAHFVREQRRVNAAEHHICSSCARCLTDPISAQRIPCMDADADHVARLHESSSIGSRVSSTRSGVPWRAGVAAASTYCQRGVMTAVPKDTSLGLTR